MAKMRNEDNVETEAKEEEEEEAAAKKAKDDRGCGSEEMEECLEVLLRRLRLASWLAP